jgi:hypothetical protein
VVVRTTEEGGKMMMGGGETVKTSDTFIDLVKSCSTVTLVVVVQV